jgi:hypothetical protein
MPRTVTPNQAVSEARLELFGRIEALAYEFEETARAFRKVARTVADAPADHNIAIGIAQELGRLMRQPGGQNAHEFLLRDLADLADYEGRRS